MHRSVAFWAGCPLGRPHSWGHSSQVSQPIPPGTWSVARALRYPHLTGRSQGSTRPPIPLWGGRDRLTGSAARRHGRRFPDEYSEGLRIASDPAQVVEDVQETSPAAQPLRQERCPYLGISTV